MTKAIALISGGLDSQLAVKIILEQGIEVIAVNFKSPFFGDSPSVYQAIKNLKIPLEILDFTEKHFQLVKAPKYGYGKNMNPCLDCHALMLNLAGEYMRKIGADFLITGEVLGQRPKSQMITGLNTVENASGFKGYILRPLCAKLLPPTIPEEKGLVNRELLLDISGRSRHRQIALAEEYDLRDYPSPAGGCKLTEPGFSIRLRKFFKYNANVVPDDVKYLKLGRHLVFDDAWLIIGRDKAENELLRNMHSEKDYLIESNSHFGPDAILHLLDPKSETPHLMSQAASLTAFYGKGKEAQEVVMSITKPNQEKYQLTVKPDNFGKLPLQ